MPKAHPVELRERVVAAYESGELSYAAVAARFEVGIASVKRWTRLSREVGSVSPRPRGGGALSTVSAAELEALLSKLGDANAGEITAAFNRRRRGRNRVHVSSIKRALHRHGYVVKKSEFGRSNSFGPMSPPNARPS
jgi:transposase